MGLGGFKPTHFQKRHPCDYCKSEDFFLGGGGGGGGGRVEGEEAQAVSNCVTQTVTSNMPCYYIEFNFDHLFIVAISVGLETRSSRVSAFSRRYQSSMHVPVLIVA